MKLTTLKNISWAFIALLMTLAGCKRDNNLNDDKKTPTPGGEVTIAAKDLVVPATFNLETEKDLTVRVGVVNTANPTERSVIKVYLSVPSAGELITTGITDAKGEFTTTLRVPAWQQFIYIERIGEDGNSEYQKVNARQFIAALFNGGQTEQFIFRKAGSGMTCSSGCTSTSNNFSGNITVNSGETKCFTGTLINGSITIYDGGTVKICGSGTINNLVVNGSGKVYFIEGSRITVNSVSLYASNSTLKNWGDSLVVNGSLGLNGAVYNYSKMYVTGSYNVYGGGYLRNEDILSIGGSLATSGDIRNYHHFTVGGAMDIYNGADVDNYCFLNVAGAMANSGSLWTNGLIKIGGAVNIYGGSENKLDNGAAWFVNSITVSANIEGTGTNRSKLKVKTTSTLYNSVTIKGKLDYCDSNGLETNQATFQSPAAISCSGYIASSTCFPERFGAPTIVDTDSDGIADSQDEYPNDATRAFNSYYPSATSTATLAYEDLWPTTGDYDFNDLVLAFNIHKVLNADNKVVDYKVKMKVRAIGAAFNNGFGFQLDELAPGDIQTITGQSLTKNIITRNANNTEASQTKAVVICFDSPEPSMQRASGSMFNTIKTNPTGTSDTIRINLRFTTPVVDSKLAIGKFNPFIFTNQRRGYEVHLGNFTPTALANTNLFGTFNDRTNPGAGRYYKNANGMPWAILLPSDLSYPAEYSSITSAYNYFDDWAVSGGTTNTDWYTNNPGNRNAANIY